MLAWCPICRLDAPNTSYIVNQADRELLRKMTKLPIVDFGAFLRGTEEDKRKIAKEIDDAFCTMGFVYLKNHGVDRDTVEECFSWSKKFFDLPPKTKMLAPHPPGGSHHRGYSAPGVEKVSQGAYDANELNKLREVSPET